MSKNEKLPENIKPEMIGEKRYDYLYIPKVFMKEEPFKAMTASAKIMYALLMEKQQKSVEMGLSDEFFDKCKSQIGKSKRYLTKDMSGGRYVDEWKLVIPENIYNLKNGVMEDATI